MQLQTKGEIRAISRSGCNQLTKLWRNQARLNTMPYGREKPRGKSWLGRPTGRQKNNITVHTEDTVYEGGLDRVQRQAEDVAMKLRILKFLWKRRTVCLAERLPDS
jgi:hypothetical protein